MGVQSLAITIKKPPVNVDFASMSSQTSTVEFEKTLGRLKEALAQPKNDFLRDSVIQRFEFTVELAWKTAKRALGLSSTAAKVVLREIAQQGLISDPSLWFSFIDARNERSHSYKEEIAEKIYSVAKLSVPELESLLDKLKKI